MLEETPEAKVRRLEGELSNLKKTPRWHVRPSIAKKVMELEDRLEAARWKVNKKGAR